jgi:hypothetical protein
MVELEGKKVLIRPSQVETTKGKEVIIGEERPPRMIKPKSPKYSQWQKNEGGKPQRCPKPTFDILMAKYKEGRAAIRGRENRIIWNTKPNSPISLSQASSSVAGSSFGKRSRTLPHRNSKGRGCHQQEYPLVPYFAVGPPMPGPWGAPPMMYLPCPPLMGWYEPWMPPPMHFHLGWSGPIQSFGHGGYDAGDDHYRHDATSRTEGPRGRKIGQSKMPNRTI